MAVNILKAHQRRRNNVGHLQALPSKRLSSNSLYQIDFVGGRVNCKQKTAVSCSVLLGISPRRALDTEYWERESLFKHIRKEMPATRLLSAAAAAGKSGEQQPSTCCLISG
ncbi:hypothetical protein KIL84_016068 [Mauremys mutica]|uniref:Uncharacterized protein n=1 Tax=Mauremys mutica TaxID=74926 RepID=A0A9D3WS01_9SAUR|nr:hypothetical protein KIL84_016068 [Mauremys mutica]